MGRRPTRKIAPAVVPQAIGNDDVRRAQARQAAAARAEKDGAGS